MENNKVKTIRLEVENANKLNINDFISKQQLISFLEDKIKEYTEFEKYLYEKENTKLVEKAKIYACIGAFREVLDFVKESDKDD